MNIPSNKMLIAILALLLGFTLAAHPANTNSLLVNLSVSKTNIYLDETLTAAFLAEGFQKEPDPPDLSKMKNFAGQLLQKNASKTTKHGKQVVFTFRLRPLQTGQLKIASLPWIIDGVSLKTRVHKIRVRQPQRSDKMALELDLNKQTCFVGQGLSLSCVWKVLYPPSSIKAVELHLPILRNSAIEIFNPDRSASQEKLTGIPVSGTRILAKRSRSKIKGKQATEFKFMRTIVPQSRGTLKLDPARLICSVTKQKDDNWDQYPSYFDNDFFNYDLSGNYQRLFAESNPLELEVRPLPKGGVPMADLIAVERFKVDLQADPVKLKVDEPLELSLTISELEHPEIISPPNLKRFEELDQRFEITELDRIGVLDKDSVRFKYTLWPKNASLKKIPRLGFSWFDPEKQTYGESFSPEIKLSVSKAKSGASALSNPIVNERIILRPNSEGIQHNFSAAEISRETGLPAISLQNLLLLICLPPLPYLLVSLAILYYRRKTSQSSQRRARKARSIFKRHCRELQNRPGETAKILALDNALRLYFAARLKKSSRSLTPAETLHLLAKLDIPDAIRDQLNQIFTLCEAVRYAPGERRELVGTSPVRQAKEIVKKLERILK